MCLVAPSSCGHTLCSAVQLLLILELCSPCGSSAPGVLGFLCTLQNKVNFIEGIKEDYGDNII